MSYFRVVPRDLFNEAKLLKCLGQISLHILDNKNCCSEHIADFLIDEKSGFKIEQNPLEGSIYSDNYKVLLKRNEEYIDLFHPLNCKLAYPLCFRHGDTEDFVFNQDGTFHEAFLDLLKGALNE